LRFGSLIRITPLCSSAASDFGQRMSIKSGDELEVLGNQFNRMADQLQDSYANLERQVE
jgi:nitrate/nitrite-specific signal transduction histidine kinase